MSLKKGFLLPALILTVCFLYGCGLSQKMESGGIQSETASSETAESEAFELSGSTLAGESVDASLFGQYRYTIITLWGTFGEPSITQLSTLNSLYEDIASENILIAGICLDAVYPDGTVNAEAFSTAEALIDEKGIAFPQYIPDKALLYGTLNGHSAVPESFIVNQDGRIVKSFLGSRTPLQWSEIISELSG